MKLAEALQKLKFDSRMVEINLKNQKISQAELKDYLGKLKDLKDQAASVELKTDGSDIDDDH